MVACGLARVVFSEESWFYLDTDDHRIRVWRRPGQCRVPRFIVELHTGPKSGVMVRGAIFHDSLTLLVVSEETLKERRYFQEILRPRWPDRDSNPCPIKANCCATSLGYYVLVGDELPDFFLIARCPASTGNVDEYVVQQLPAGDNYALMPVMVWIHRGGFVGGSGDINPKHLLDLEVVVVSINYRLAQSQEGGLAAMAEVGNSSSCECGSSWDHMTAPFGMYSALHDEGPDRKWLDRLERIVPAELGLKRGSAASKAMATKIKYFYFPNQTMSYETRQQWIELMACKKTRPRDSQGITYPRLSGTSVYKRTRLTHFVLVIYLPFLRTTVHKPLSPGIGRRLDNLLPVALLYFQRRRSHARLPSACGTLRRPVETKVARSVFEKFLLPPAALGNLSATYRNSISWSTCRLPYTMQFTTCSFADLHTRSWGMRFDAVHAILDDVIVAVIWRQSSYTPKPELRTYVVVSPLPSIPSHPRSNKCHNIYRRLCPKLLAAAGTSQRLSEQPWFPPDAAACRKQIAVVHVSAFVENTAAPREVRSLTDFRMWESSRTMLLVGGFSRHVQFPPPLHSGAAPYSSRFILIGSQGFDVKSRSNLFTHSLSITPTKRYLVLKCGTAGDNPGTRITCLIVSASKALRKLLYGTVKSSFTLLLPAYYWLTVKRDVSKQLSSNHNSRRKEQVFGVYLASEWHISLRVSIVCFVGVGGARATIISLETGSWPLKKNSIWWSKKPSLHRYSFYELRIITSCEPASYAMAPNTRHYACVMGCVLL
ncbi:hypothetical protein PR048_004231 [Dryococelus australis]|uniref:Carboxylesterase type B domain-containing protein n=1 Tax=Dryococelus australis TaxID=614101 RepID=A0ABQ9I4X3_9NEOP|nr:hypothetical protein PR048_004231 [Dryococelus australis]